MNRSARRSGCAASRPLDVNTRPDGSGIGSPSSAMPSRWKAIALRISRSRPLRAWRRWPRSRGAPATRPSSSRAARPRSGSGSAAPVPLKSVIVEVPLATECLPLVFGCKSSDRFPATVTFPRLTGCRSCRWLPLTATTYQPSAFEQIDRSRRPSRPSRRRNADRRATYDRLRASRRRPSQLVFRIARRTLRHVRRRRPVSRRTRCGLPIPWRDGAVPLAAEGNLSRRGPTGPGGPVDQHLVELALRRRGDRERLPVRVSRGRSTSRTTEPSEPRARSACRSSTSVATGPGGTGRSIPAFVDRGRPGGANRPRLAGSDDRSARRARPRTRSTTHSSDATPFARTRVRLHQIGLPAARPAGVRELVCDLPAQGDVDSSTRRTSSATPSHRRSRSSATG